MNIKEAKDEISNTLKAYHEKNENGDYCYPLVRQRPILLMGPPGIGKTAIMEQIASENQVGLVAYTITHHTRQSAVGLPRIQEKNYDGKEISVTEYTMSEIIDSVYDCMQRTGKREGILFIDEINCASETLAPTMLQFLQNKTFGSHKVPEGWMIVAAGNPPEYNKSVREFDIVTLDRIRRIDVEEDCGIWLEYARNAWVHGAIISYLGMKKDQFYRISNTPAEKHFVTARGWEDLSEMLKSYERLRLSVTEKQVIQFLQNEDTAHDFAAYYQLYRKYGSDYNVKDIVEGTISTEAYQQKIQMALAGGFEERFTLTELIAAYLDGEFNHYQQMEEKIRLLHGTLQRYKKEKEKQTLQDFISGLEKSMKVRRDAQILSSYELYYEKWQIRMLKQYDLQIRLEHLTDTEKGFATIQRLFEDQVKEYRHLVEQIKAKLEHAIVFLEECYGDGQEMVLFITELSRSEKAMLLISEHGCDAFFRHSGKLLYKKCRDDLLKACLEEVEKEV